jgi:hypothetical protein
MKTLTCDCGLKFTLDPRDILMYEDHLPCPAQELEA